MYLKLNSIGKGTEFDLHVMKEIKFYFDNYKQCKFEFPELGSRDTVKELKWVT